MGEVISYPRTSKFTAEDFDNLKPSKTFWRVRHVWPSVGVAFVYGPSMSGKSFRVLAWMTDLCRGLPILGKRSTAAGVLYIASEGAQGVRNRIVGLRSCVGSMRGRFKFIGQAPNLTDVDDVADLRVTIAETQEAMKSKAATDLGVVVVDTLSASIPGADENTSKDMGPVLAALQSMAQEMGLLVIVIAHAGKDEQRGLRGWSGQLANADGVIVLDDPKGAEVRTGSVVKVKDGPAGQRFGFRLEVLEIGVDDDLEPITTCIARDAELPDEDGQGRAERLNAPAMVVKQAIGRLLDEGAGEPVPLTVPGVRPDTTGTTLDRLREYAYGLGLQKASQPPPEAPETEHRKWTEARKKAFQRALDRLIETRNVRQEGEWIWSP